MAQTDIYQQVLTLLSELSGEADLQVQTRLKDDLALDSIELVQLVLRLNSTFGLQIHSSEILPAHFGTLGQVADFITHKLAISEAANGTRT